MIPPGRRSDVERLLTRCVVNPEFRAEYVKSLTALWLRHRIDETLVDPVGKDIPEAEIVENGFKNLSDEILADIAFDPVAVEMVAEMLVLKPRWRDAPHDSREWLVKAFCEDLGYPTSNPIASEAAPVPTDAVRPSNVMRWPSTVIAIAASLLLGVFIGYLAFRGKRETTDRSVEVAQASLKSAEPRGPDALAFDVELVSPRDGFATVVIPRRGREPKVFPEYLKDDLRVEAKAARRLGPYEAGSGEVVLVVVTKTPSSETIRRATMNLAPNASVEDIESKIKDALWGAGHDWTVVGRVTARQLAK